MADRSCVSVKEVVPVNGEGRMLRIDATSLRGAECSQVMKTVEESI